MCGIFAAIINHPIHDEFKIKLRENAILSQHRGPDCSVEEILDDKTIYFMFHRLAINGLHEMGNQPMKIDKYPSTTLICNGEIYNFQKLASDYGIRLTTGSDCEIIIHLYHKLGIDQCIRSLDGVFSFVIFDNNRKDVIIGHDPLGVRSLYWTNDVDCMIVSSELKCVHALHDKIEMYPPGCYTLFGGDGVLQTTQYFQLPTYSMCDSLVNDSIPISIIQTKLLQSVKKRLLSERPIGCFLSGGIDSSIIASLTSKLLYPQKLRTFSIGCKGSKDLDSAKIVATHLDTDHTEVIVSEQEMLDAIQPTIQQIESYDTTTVRASVPMYLLSKYIKENTDIKVVLSGEGADELFGSYLYFHNAPTPESFHNECVRLLTDIQKFDVLRGDKTTAGNGLEIRVPFLDKEFVQLCLLINPSLRVPRFQQESGATYEKYLLRKAFSNDLPKEIVWRRKDGFSDGVSPSTKLWSEIIQDFTNPLYKDDMKRNLQKEHLPPQTTEQYWYRHIFETFYPNYVHIIPYFWMPKWSEEDSNDPSGRKLSIFHS